MQEKFVRGRPINSLRPKNTLTNLVKCAMISKTCDGCTAQAVLQGVAKIHTGGDAAEMPASPRAFAPCNG